MPKLQNTFWTKFDNNFYRLKNGALYQAPCNDDNTVDTNNLVTATSVSSAILEQINSEFGSEFTSGDFS